MRHTEKKKNTFTSFISYLGIMLALMSIKNWSDMTPALLPSRKETSVSMSCLEKQLCVSKPGSKFRKPWLLVMRLSCPRRRKGRP